MSLTPNALFSIMAALQSEAPLTTSALAQRLRDLKWADVFEDELRGLLTVTSVVRSVGGDAWMPSGGAEVRKEATRLARSAPPGPIGEPKRLEPLAHPTPVLLSALFLEPHLSEAGAFATTPAESANVRESVALPAPRTSLLPTQNSTLGTQTRAAPITPSVRLRKPNPTSTARPAELMGAIRSALLATATDGLTCGRCLMTMRRSKCRCRT